MKKETKQAIGEVANPFNVTTLRARISTVVTALLTIAGVLKAMLDALPSAPGVTE